MPPAASRTRQLAKGIVNRLPVGQDLARRIGRSVLRRTERVSTPSAGGPRALADSFRVKPEPRAVDPNWPEPPTVEGAIEITAQRFPGLASPPTNFDVELFEALNAEYAPKPLVPIPPNTSTSAGISERAIKRLTMVHDSIDLAGKRVLEFGCGAGYVVWLLSHHFGADAYGVDVVRRRSWDHLEGERTHLLLADMAQDQPFPANHFDRIISFSVFEHVAHPASSLAELHRVLRPGGLAWISANLYRGPRASHRYREVNFPFPHLLFDNDVFREFYRRRGETPQGASWVNRLSWSDYEDLFERVGFKLRALRFGVTPLDKSFYERFEAVLGTYPRVDLTRDFFHVVAEKV